MSSTTGFRIVEVLESDKNFNYLKDYVIYIKSGVDSINIKVSTGILMKVNGVFKREATIGLSDLIEVAIKSIDSFRKINLNVSKDLMSASILCEYIEGEKYGLKEYSFDKELVIDKVEDNSANCDKYSLSEIIEFLKTNSVISGIQYKNIESAINGEKIEIAAGIEVTETIDDKIELNFNKVKSNTDDIKKVNYFDSNNLQSVKKGDILARVKRGIKGKDGKTIKGTVISAKDIKKIKVHAGEGIRVIGDTVIAINEGRPIFVEKSYKFYIEKKYDVPLDVDSKTGNIKFNGQVLVRGSVKEHFLVYGSAGVEILGDVTGGNVNSLSDIKINGKVLNSKIESGISKVQFEAKLNVLNKIQRSFNNLKQDLDVIVSNDLLRGKKVGSIIKALLESKYKEIETSYDFIKSDIETLFGNITSLSDIYEKKILRLEALNIKSLDEIDDILSIIEKYIDEIKEIFNFSTSIRLSYVQGSNVSSKGNIYIVSDGVYASRMISDDSIFFEDENTILRGGYLNAKNLIKAGIIGTKSGVLTEVEVDKNGRIECNRAYYNTIFKLGNIKVVLEDNYKNLKVYVEDGQIILDGVKF